VYDGFPSRNIGNWFQSRKEFKKIKSKFKPDFVLIDRQRHFGLAAIKENIPLLVHLRGDYWSEIQWAKETIYKSFPKNIVIKHWEKIAEECFSKSKIILPICNYLETQSKKHYPDKKSSIMYQGINSSNWYPTDGMKLKHPCVGLVQGAAIWGKTKEMLILPKILQAYPEITFYWAGDGPYAKKILASLNKYDNFQWLGSLEYPNKVRDFLMEIDVYALVSGIDMAPLTLQEAQLMKKPVLATRVAGIPELMKNNETGFLINEGDYEDWIDKIGLLINDQEKCKEMGEHGRKFVEDNFSWKVIVKKFLEDLKKID
jgi:glycosyltransferase involved in cell wall biosynthesis